MILSISLLGDTELLLFATKRTFIVAFGRTDFLSEKVVRVMRTTTRHRTPTEYRFGIYLYASVAYALHLSV